jgi:hypothetical protein
MPSYGERLKLEVARRDAALSALQDALATAGKSLSDPKTSPFAPISKAIKAELNPAHQIAKHPWLAAGSALAAGILVFPLVRSFFGMFAGPKQTEPQRVVIEVVNAGQSAQILEKPEKPLTEVVMEALVLFGEAKVIIQNLVDAGSVHTNGNGNGSYANAPRDGDHPNGKEATAKHRFMD